MSCSAACSRSAWPQRELSWRAATGLADGIGAVYHWIEAGAPAHTALPAAV